MTPTEKMIEAAAAAMWAGRSHIPWADIFPRTQEHYREGARTALTAALAVEAGTVGVKPLEWRTFCSLSGNCEAKTKFGEYVIQSETDGWCLYLLNQDDHHAAYSSLDAAKAAAQSDYETRIRSALTPASSAVEGEAVATITIDGREYRKFIPYPEEITDGTLRCISCGQIDDEPYHDDACCPACPPAPQTEGRE